MKRITYLILIGLALSLVLSAQSQSRIVELGSDAPSPSARVTSIDPGAGVIFFGWVGDDGFAVGSGTYIARFAPLTADAETGEFAGLTDAEIVAAILAPDPPAPVPASVTPYQLWRALKAEFGLSRTEVLTAVNAITNADTKDAYLTAIETPQTYERADPTIVALGLMLSLSSDDLDTVFRAAARL